MTIYPFEIDSDADIIRVDDNISEIGGEAINQLRDAVFAIEKELGIRPAGSAGSVASRLNQSLNQDGSIRTSALTSVGLVALPITDGQVGTNAGISEFKLALDYSTSDLNTLIVSNGALLAALTAFASAINSDLGSHIAGGAVLIDGSPGRHVASHIDLNVVPSDTRDVLFIWGGLFDKDGVARTARTVMEALDQINSDFVDHQNETASAHVATAVDIDTDDFQEIPQTVDTVQKLADHIDDFEVITIADHRATQHANCIPKIGRVSACSMPDGYGQNVVANTPVNTFLVRSPNITPVDSISNGDDVVSFQPIDNSDFSFDAQFSQVAIGDVIRINYGSGFEASFNVESIRYTPGSEWIVRINGVNLVDSIDGYASARIDRSLFDRDTSGILAVAAANATPTGSFDTILQSVIVGHPRGAVALGNGSDPGQLDANHYNLYLELYPTGNPDDRVISMPAIDVTGNAGITPGRYTLDSVVHETNKKFREIGYNYRFIAFADHGNFGIMLADAISCASFSITSGAISAGVLVVGLFTENVVGDAAATGFDVLGLGNTHADLASPSYTGSYIDTTNAQLPTKVIVPYKSRDYIVDGQRRETFAPTWLATEDASGNGYWDGYISDRTVVGAFTVETTYTILLDLKAAELKPGKTIVVQPAIALTDANYFDVDYGRFIIKSVTFPPICVGVPAQTLITVISGIHAYGSGVAFSSSPSLAVKLYFSEDSVSFNDDNIIESVPSGVDYHRLHEIFIDRDGKTFSHERGRMAVQGEGLSPPLLRTDVWHIENVSPKLRGYRDNTTTFNKYLRFYILTYDTTSGEYTGYIGQRDPSSDAILSVGPVTTGRKGVPTRFYDETNVDYIDLVFVEGSPSSAGIAILTTALARYVDIEVFDSLQLNDDLMLLATVEVNWDPASSQEVIQRVVNRREFGSIDEEDFTESAIDFITAGDRHLHDNGIIRGFDFDTTAADAREIFYKGGVALVNGKVLTTNAISVTIPEITEDPGPTGTLDWAVCVNEEGLLEPILITSAKDQFWAEENTSGSTYYVPSVTFAELVETRKDLVPIDVVTVSISSFAVDNNADVRRFIDDGKNRELVYSPENFAGTFHTAAALVNWVNNYASTSPLVAKMRGEFSATTTQDFASLVSGLILDGDGAVFNVTADKGFAVSQGLTLRNIRFNYNPDTAAISFSSADDKINSANGCIYGTGDIDDITIENCVFVSSVTATTQRPPFISFEINKEDVVKEVNICNNTFADTGTTDVQAAFAIVSSNDSVDTEPAIVYNLRIENNDCKQRQGIFILQKAIDQTSYVSSITGPGILAYDTIISGNNCGVIGYLTSEIASTASLITDNYRTSGLTIKHNTCHLIANMANLTFATATVPGTQVITESYYLSPFPGGAADIYHNNCNCMYITATDNDISEDVESRLSIEGNRLKATNPATLNNWSPTLGIFGSGTSQTYGIFVSNGDDDGGEVIIANNSIKSGKEGASVYKIDACIRSQTACNITGNIIKGIEAGGRGIIAEVISPIGSIFREYLVSGNKIFRESESISHYIELEGNSAFGGGLCVDNWFDYPTIDGSDDEVISGTGTSPGNTHAQTWIVERNKNQTELVVVPTNTGMVGVASGLDQSTFKMIQPVMTERVEYVISSGDVWLQFVYLTTSGDKEMGWAVPLGCLPPNVLFISMSVDYTLDVVTPTTANLRISISNNTTEEDDSAAPVAVVGSGASESASFTPSGVFYNNDGLTVLLRIGINDNTSAVFDFKELRVAYRW